MGCSQNCICCHATLHLIISLLLLLASSFSFIQVTFMAEARAISHLINAAQKVDHEETMVVVRRNLIGSAPPRCERRCKSCEHCVAIQVPVTNLHQNRRRSHYTSATLSRGDDVSNYKPISWKCKCGNFIFNP